MKEPHSKCGRRAKTCLVGSNPTPSAILSWRGVRVAEGACLENMQAGKNLPRGFESHPLRQFFLRALVVLDGEVAVPSARNPLERG